MKSQVSYEHIAQYYLSHNPSGAEKEIWIVLHGYGQLAEFFLRKFNSCFSEERLFVAPEATNYNYLNGFSGRVGANWMTRHERELAISNNQRLLNSLIDTICNEYEVLPKINVLGFSQGAATASRWCNQLKYPISKLVLWGGGFANDLQIEGLGDALKLSEVIVVLGDQDEFITTDSIQKQEELILSLEVKVNNITYSGGHDLHTPTLEMIVLKKN
ncbi:alpha/beta hydrolase [Belliella sp. R4-6]|uniref:Alpha/beta hydrolase n=1 Tax=Belliella alkalica TaxID=1730871 RepID=A0ABS9V8M2_9BACT|nr:alpha/beta hydrolase [Belliella alkalica]MCH7412775.1 alpha/beta hydrolase [Belliella alkalica]